MSDLTGTPNAFRAAPVIDYQFLLSADQPEVPASFSLTQVGDLWLAADKKLPLTTLRDAQGGDIGLLVGFAYSVRIPSSVVSDSP